MGAVLERVIDWDKRRIFSGFPQSRQDSEFSVFRFLALIVKTQKISPVPELTSKQGVEQIGRVELFIMTFQGQVDHPIRIGVLSGFCKRVSKEHLLSNEL